MVSYLTQASTLGGNLFAYCENNAVVGYDPTGEWDVNKHVEMCTAAGCDNDSRFCVWNGYADKRYYSNSAYSAPFHGRPAPEVFSIVKELYNLSLPLKGKDKNHKTKFSYSKSGKGYTKLSSNLNFQVKDSKNSNYNSMASKISSAFLSDLNGLPTGDAQSRALMGLALHTLQDYFAHSLLVNVYVNNKRFSEKTRMTIASNKLKSKYGVSLSKTEDNPNLFSFRVSEARTATIIMYDRYCQKKKMLDIFAVTESNYSKPESISFVYDRRRYVCKMTIKKAKIRFVF